MAKGGFRGGYGGMGGMNQANMMKQAQKMQQELAKMQAELEASTFTATAGGGVVKATVSGIYLTKVRSLRGPALVAPPKAGFFKRLKNKVTKK